MATDRAGSNDGDHLGIASACSLQESAVVAIIIVPARAQAPIVTREARKLLGLKGSRAGLPEPLKELIKQALSSNKSPAPRRFRVPGPDGAGITLQATVGRLPMTKKAASVVIVLTDLSATEDFEGHLRRIESLASIGTLATGLAHEIKNALVAGKTFIELLLEKNQDNELGQVVRREMNRIDSIVSQMLKFGSAGRRVHTAVRLHEILNHSLRLVKPQLKGRAISLSQTFRAEPDVVEGDDFQLQQAFVNLFLNALEAMGPHGTLTVATDTVATQAVKKVPANVGAAKQLRVTIKDTGIGIPVDVKDRLFEPFFTTKRSGTGLGLPITRRIIQEHRGDISVESAPNEGATFRILLPVYSAERTSMRTTEPPRSRAN